MEPELCHRIQDLWYINWDNMKMCCDVLSLNIANGDGFDDDGYSDGVGVGDEYGDFLWEGMVCGCD